MSKHYQCFCGKVVLVTPGDPCPCSGCSDCKTVPRPNGDPPQKIQPHKWRVLRIETDSGMQTVTRCVWCAILKGDIKPTRTGAP